MQEFLKLFYDYNGDNKKLQAYAKKLQTCEDEYNCMYELLEQELSDQKEEQDRSYSQNRTEHDRLFKFGII